ncbi:MAG TPA: histidine kinase dimerization/phospho-acceptor domain-containing protein, partial [Pyrinomonadaceae bacterium]|nr:histidine kinase dimerization/phospho-acceptor domain-containing protein [Pyrinomonadaceae bacterium]
MRILKSSTFKSLAVSVCVSLCVAALWGGGLLDSLCEVFLLKSPAGASVPPQWWAALLLVLGAGAGAAYAVERAGACRAALFVGCAGAAACVASLAASKLLQLDVVFAPTMLAASLSLFAAQARRLWEIDAALTRSVQRVASRPSALEGRGANARLMCGLKLLATVLPLDEAVIFRLDAAGLPEQAARLRTESNGAAAALPGSPEPDRNDAWREGVALCERAVRSRSLATREGAAGTAVALPLEHDGAAVGALLLRLRGGFDETDRPLLANVSAQFARDLQRDEARSLDVPQPPQTFASTRAARQRLESVGVLSGLLTEQGFAAHALSEARDAHAVAYLDGTLACVNPRMLEAARVTAAECRALDLFGLLERFRAGVFDEPSIAVRRVLQTGQPYERELTYAERGQTLALRIALVTDAAFSKETPARAAKQEGASALPLCLAVTVRDVTRIKEYEKLKSDMLSLMSHELRTPITSINGFAELLMADENVPEESREFLGIISSESQRLTRMI